MAAGKPAGKAKRRGNHVYKIYKIEGDKAVRQRKTCPKCGQGVFMAQHNGRTTCGRCHYTEFDVKKK